MVIDQSGLSGGGGEWGEGFGVWEVGCWKISGVTGAAIGRLFVLRTVSLTRSARVMTFDNSVTELGVTELVLHAKSPKLMQLLTKHDYN